MRKMLSIYKKVTESANIENTQVFQIHSMMKKAVNERVSSKEESHNRQIEREIAFFEFLPLAIMFNYIRY